MKIAILYFAAVRELVGAEREELELPASVRSIADLGAWLERERAPLRDRLSHVRFAINEEFADPQDELRDGDVVALIPPVAGGRT